MIADANAPNIDPTPLRAVGCVYIPTIIFHPRYPTNSWINNIIYVCKDVKSTGIII